MRASIRLDAGVPYVEIGHTHSTPKTAAEDAIEHFFDRLEVDQYCSEPVTVLAIYDGRMHSDSQPSESRIRLRLMPISEAVVYLQSLRERNSSMKDVPPKEDPRILTEAAEKQNQRRLVRPKR